MNIDEQKKEQRALAKNRRSSLNNEERALKSEIICQKLISAISELKLDKGGAIMSYMAIGTEVDLGEFNKWASDNGFKLAFPVIAGSRLIVPRAPFCYNEFITECLDEKSLAKNKYNIKEPDESNSEIISESDISLVLVPLLAYDDELYRMGYGGGFYDNFLPKCKNATKLGIAFDIQKTDKIVRDEHDFKLDGMVIG